MRLITKIEVNTSLNAKARELELFMRRYTGCLFPSKQLYNDFLLKIYKTLEQLNDKYPRTKPFIVYYRYENLIYISVKDNPEKWVSRITTHSVERVYIDDSIHLIENCNIEITELKL